jgi:LCP family protein required for cell wall assembly
MRAIRLLAAALAAMVVVSSCTGGSPTEPITTTPPSTTSTTTATTVTTTTVPQATVSVSLVDGPDGLDEAVADLYLYAADPSVQPAPSRVSSGLIDHLSGLDSRSEEITVDGEVAVGEIVDTQVAVMTSGDDVVLAVADSDGTWRIVGARLTRFESPAWFGESPRLVLVIGSDARPGQNPLGYRADSLHLIGTVPASGAGAIVGIPRDAWVEASYGGNNKFTNVMASRGPEVVLETARNLTGLPLEGYLVTGFLGFEQLVDAFGGFDFDVPFAMAEPQSKAYFAAGLQLFSGADALAFARNRTLAGGDFTRSFHHGLLMIAALRKVQSLGFGDLPRLLELLVEYTWTDLDAEQLLTLGASAYELDPETLTNMVVEGQVGTAGSASVVFLTEEAFSTFEDLADGALEGD